MEHPTIPFYNEVFPDVAIDSMNLSRRFRFYNANEGELAKGMVFVDKKNLQSAVKDFSVRFSRREYQVIQSGPTLWKVKCKHSLEGAHCDWWLRAIYKERIRYWEITKYGSTHTCLMQGDVVDHQNLCRNMIAVMMRGMVEKNPAYEIKGVQQRIEAKYQYEISYQKAWQGLKRARELVYGTWESSIQNLPKFMGAIQKYNRGTVVEWEHMPNGTDQMQVLKYVFWAFRPCIDGFQHCRQIISVDGTHLYTKYRHKLLIAVAYDANKHLFPLAYAFVDEETRDSWTWFLHQLAVHVVRGRAGVCLISDRHPGILEAVRRVPTFQHPNGVHRFCLRHVRSNFNSRFKSGRLKDLCWTAGAASTSMDFDHVMEQIREENQRAYDYLVNIERSQWTLAHDGGWRGGILTTNLSECMNSVLKGARRLPACAIVKVTLYRSVKVFRNRLAEGLSIQQRNQPRPDELYNDFDKVQRASMHQQIWKFDIRQKSAQVMTWIPGSTNHRTYVVKLLTKECSCGKWKQYDPPCSHAMTACRHFRVDPATYMMSFHSTSSFVGTYSGTFEPINDERDWDEPSFQLRHNPTLRTVRCRGRDRTTRIPNEMDWAQIRPRQQYQAADGSGPSRRR